MWEGSNVFSRRGSGTSVHGDSVHTDTMESVLSERLGKRKEVSEWASRWVVKC